MSTRTLRWTSQSDIDRCARTIAEVCSTWLLAWTGREQPPTEVTATEPSHAVSSGDVCSLALSGGARICLASSGSFPWALFEDTQAVRTRPAGASIAAEVGKTCEADLVARLMPQLAGAAGSDAAPAWGTLWPEDALYSGGTCFLAKWDRAALMLHVSGDLLRRDAPRAAAQPAPQPLDRATLARLAARSTVRGSLKLPDVGLGIGSLLRAEVGDVIVLDRKLTATFQWEVPELGLRLPANLVRVGDQLAIELISA